jgi:hypothetical protein
VPERLPGLRIPHREIRKIFNPQKKAGPADQLFSVLWSTLTPGPIVLESASLRR